MREILFLSSLVFVFTEPIAALAIALISALLVRAPELIIVGALIDIFFGVPGTVPYATLGIVLVLWGMEPLRAELADS